MRPRIALLLLLSTSAAADVIVVDPTGGGDFVGIQGGINSATDGDTVLVKSGSYGRAWITGKSLNVVADRDASVRIDGAIRVRGLDRDQIVTISGIEVDATETSDELDRRALFAYHNDGRVQLQDCELRNTALPCDSSCGSFPPAAAFEDCQDVVLSTTRVDGRRDALELRASVASMYDTQAVATQNGGTGLSFQDGSLGFLSGGGATGGYGQELPCLAGLIGGLGLAVSNESLVRWVSPGTVWVGGSGGCGFDPGGISVCGLCGCDFDFPCGPDGAAITGPNVELPFRVRTISMPAVLRAGESFDLTVQGVVGDRIYLAITTSSTSLDDPFGTGPLVDAKGQPLEFLGTLHDPAKRDGFGSRTAPALAAGVEAQVFLLQCVHVDSAGDRFPGTVRTLTVLDASL